MTALSGINLVPMSTSCETTLAQGAGAGARASRGRGQLADVHYDITRCHSYVISPTARLSPWQNAASASSGQGVSP